MKVNGKDYLIYYGKKKMFQTTNQYLISAFLLQFKSHHVSSPYPQLVFHTTFSACLQPFFLQFCSSQLRTSLIMFWNCFRISTVLSSEAHPPKKRSLGWDQVNWSFKSPYRVVQLDRLKNSGSYKMIVILKHFSWKTRDVSCEGVATSCFHWAFEQVPTDPGRATPTQLDHLWVLVNAGTSPHTERQLDPDRWKSGKCDITRWRWEGSINQVIQ